MRLSVVQGGKPPNLARRMTLKAHAAHDGARKHADCEHDEAPDRGRVHDGRSAIDGAENDASHRVGLAGKGGHG